MTPYKQIVSEGFCWCGCGFSTPEITRNRLGRGFKKGDHLHYIKGHQFFKERPPVIDGHFKIDGVYCRLIPLTQGLYAIVDENDYEWIMKYRWYAAWSPILHGYYALRHELEGKRETIKMHREILGLAKTDPREGDHVHPENTLDNRRNNLRSASNLDNARNQRRPRNSSTGFKGVTKNSNGSFRARVRDGVKTIHLGYFPTAELAYEAYCRGAKKYHGEFWHG